MATDVQGAIYRADSAPARCSGCARPSAKLPRNTVWTCFPNMVFRGVIRDSVSAAELERIESINLCSDCVARAAAVLDPQSARRVRQEVADERLRLQEQVALLVKKTAAVRARIDEGEQRLRELQKAADDREQLLAKARTWRANLLQHRGEFRELRLRVWALERELLGDDSDEGAAEVQAAREELDKARSKLRSMLTAGGRLEGQLAEKHQEAERRLVRETLETTGDDDE